MPRPSSSRPTDSELEILGVLWDKGAATVREVHEELSLRKPTGYTTVLKFMQIMMDKGLITIPRLFIHVNREHVTDYGLKAFSGSGVNNLNKKY